MDVIGTGWIQNRRDIGFEGSGHEGCGTGDILDRRDAGQVGCRKRGMQEIQEMRNANLVLKWRK